MTSANDLEIYARRLVAKGRLLEAGFILDIVKHLDTTTRNSNVMVDLRSAYFAGAIRVFANVIDDPPPDGLIDRLVDTLRLEIDDNDETTKSLRDHYEKHGKKGSKLSA